MDDETIHDAIKRLVDEEHAIWSGGAATDDDRARLRELNVSLDQCWDLLRQRQALRDAGENPDAAHSRPTDEVESYLQ
jgi:hypothetical protein